MSSPHVPDREKYIERAAQDIAAIVFAWTSEDRARIRRRVQELLRCKDDELKHGLELLSAPREDIEKVWTRAEARHAIERAAVPIFGNEQSGDFYLIRTTKNAVLKEFGITR